MNLKFLLYISWEWKFLAKTLKTCGELLSWEELKGSLLKVSKVRCLVEFSQMFKIIFPHFGEFEYQENLKSMLWPPTRELFQLPSLANLTIFSFVPKIRSVEHFLHTNSSPTYWRSSPYDQNLHLVYIF